MLRTETNGFSVQVAELIAGIVSNVKVSKNKIVEAVAETTAPLRPIEDLLAEIPSVDDIEAEKAAATEKIAAEKAAAAENIAAQKAADEEVGKLPHRVLLCLIFIYSASLKHDFVTRNSDRILASLDSGLFFPFFGCGTLRKTDTERRNTAVAMFFFQEKLAKRKEVEAAKQREEEVGSNYSSLCSNACIEGFIRATDLGVECLHGGTLIG